MALWWAALRRARQWMALGCSCWWGKACTSGLACTLVRGCFLGCCRVQQHCLQRMQRSYRLAYADSGTANTMVRLRMQGQT